MKYVYEGSATGKGSVQHFTSENSGEGRIEIVESVPNEKIVMEMDFKMGDEKLPRATYLFAPTGDGKTKVTWLMDGETSMRPIGNYFGLVMDSMLGADFERGLENLDKAVTSAPPVVPVEAKPVEVAPVEAVPVEVAPVEAAVARVVEAFADLTTDRRDAEIEVDGGAALRLLDGALTALLGASA
jgi:hypothetical protein